ncbi:MAG: glyoxalase [Alphaproteobacteria bacterium]|nr:MAG: glyoxalase [Alphaproteobacteria bacterium]
MVQPFHLAVPVDDLQAARDFYGGVMGCPEGRSSERWIDFDFFGHQFVVHLGTPVGQPDCNDVDGKQVPSFHYGVVLDWDDWHALAVKLAAAEIEFIIEPGIRFEGEVGEQATMFFLDPAGNALEFKAFRDIGQLFAR